MKRADYNIKLSRDTMEELNLEPNKNVCLKNTPPIDQYNDPLLNAIYKKNDQEKNWCKCNTSYNRYPDMNEVYYHFYRLIENHINLNNPYDNFYPIDEYKAFNKDAGVILSNGCENALRQMISCLIYNYRTKYDGNIEDIEFYYEEPGWRLAKFCALQAGIPEYNIIPLKYEAHISDIPECEQSSFQAVTNGKKSTFSNVEFVLNADNIKAEKEIEEDNKKKFRILYATDKANSWIIHSMKNIDTNTFDKIILDESITMESVINHSSTLTFDISRIGSFSKLVGASFRVGYILTKEPNIDIFREHYLNKAGVDLLSLLYDDSCSVCTNLHNRIKMILGEINNKTIMYNIPIELSDSNSNIDLKKTILNCNHFRANSDLTMINQYIGNISNTIGLVDLSKIKSDNYKNITVKESGNKNREILSITDTMNNNWISFREKEYQILPVVKEGVKEKDLLVIVKRFYKRPKWGTSVDIK